MAARLIEPGDAGNPPREIPIQSEEFVIGRGADCDLRVMGEDISRHHCLIRVRGGGEATISDLGSANGTFLNNQRVLSQATMRSGDEIRVAGCRFILDLGDRPDLMPSDVDSMAVTRRIPKKTS